MISVPQKLNLKSIDALLQQVQIKPDDVLSFPSELELRSILTTSAFNQFLLTWAGLSQRREVQFNLASPEHIPFLARSAETLIPLLLAKVASFQVANLPSEHSVDVSLLRRQGLELFAPIKGVAVQQSLFGPDEPTFPGIPRRGPKVQLLMSDSDFRHGSPHWFYCGLQENRKLRDANDLASLVRSVLGLIRDNSVKKFGAWVDGIAEPLGNMLYELLDNTDKWGKQTILGEPVKSIRGALFDIKFDYPGNKTRLSDVASDVPLLNDFIAFHSRQSETRNLGLLEMTVFDGGIGLAARELERRGKRAPSVQEEYDATLDCLKKWGTTSGQVGRGLGLDQVLDLTAQQKGFVYLRTGRLVLYRDFANHQVGQSVDGGKSGVFERHVLHDGCTHTIVPSERNQVKGTLFSVVLPFSASTP